ncbi:MAG: hypothetical protein AAGI36_18170, partial [Pseudomonadota bacterium]
VTLIVCSAWAFLSIEKTSPTALIPGGFGLAILACYPRLKTENKTVAHVVVVLTLVILIALYAPLSSAFQSGNAPGILRVLVMMLTSAIALLYFIKRFREARQDRQ